MNRSTLTNCNFPHTDLEQAKQKVLSWIQQFDTFCFLENHGYGQTGDSRECLAAAGHHSFFKANAGNALEGLQKYLESRKGWYFGHLGYDLKNEIEELDSRHPDRVGFPDLFFFEPRIVVELTPTDMIIHSEDPADIHRQIILAEEASFSRYPAPVIKSRITREDYLAILSKLKTHIRRGDCFEINFCMEFYAEDARIHPGAVYRELSRLSPNPFSAFYRIQDRWLMCASPERFIRKKGETILSQPIKGTATRDLADKAADERNRQALYTSEKDRAENVMVVDLVRNDLSKVCVEGTVQVDELFGIYSFPQVHQMISSVSGRLKKGMAFSDIIRASFPMGSMTGAPKKRVMELIEVYEKTKRGLFSGSVGYIDPDGDFDFNVVIRSLLYNQQDHYLSFQAGSGITFYSIAEKEWEECLLKAAAIKKILE